jgi:hypothetical protein
VADVFEGFGCILAADVEEDFFTTAVDYGDRASVIGYEAGKVLGGRVLACMGRGS